jgi:ferredoxin
MKTVIYYFTGTGNSYSAAARLCESIGDCILVPIASLPNDTIVPDGRCAGIVCPVYDMGLPEIVDSFARRLDIRDTEYVFAVLTMAGVGVSALHQLDRILKRRGKGLDGAWTVLMPGNFVPLYSPPTGAKKEKILDRANTRIDTIAGRIKRGEKIPPAPAPFSSLLWHLLYPGYIRNIERLDEKFWVTDDCIFCRTCAKVCPVENIEMVDGMPKWLHNCQLCLACMHFCPTDAIQWGSRTENRGRYLHPEFGAKKMKRQRPGADNINIQKKGVSGEETTIK